MKSIFSVSLLLAFALLACRETDDIRPNHPPVAVAGNDSVIVSSIPMVLDGSASSDGNDDPLEYIWTFISKPSASTSVIQHFDSIRASFTPDVQGSYSIRLRVTDNISTDYDTVVYLVESGNQAPIAAITNVPTGVNLGQNILLQGNASSDPDGDPLTYNWIVVSKPAGSIITPATPNQSASSFTFDKPGSYTIQLQVSDGSLTDVAQTTLKTNNPVITSINPTTGPYGISVKIIGNNFSNVIGENTVRFNNMVATVSSASYTELVAVVPKGAGTGNVTVTVNGVTATGPVFTYQLSAVVSTLQQFTKPVFMAADAAGNIYISDYASHVIRRLSTNGQLTTIAGTGVAGFVDAKDPLQAQFRNPAGIAVDASGNIYVADNSNHSIRRISTSGDVFTIAGIGQAGFADGAGNQAQFNSPIGLAVDGSGNLYVGDTGNHRIRRISTQGNVFTFAGIGQSGFADGHGSVAQFNGIAGLTFANGNVYVADLINQRVRVIDGQGMVSTLAGDGTAGLVNGAGSVARFNNPYGVGADASGNIYVAEFSNHTIRKITPQVVVSTLAGTGAAGFADGPANTAQFNTPTDVLAVGTRIYVADYGNNRVRLMDFE